MRGELYPVWSETWREIWSKLAKHPGAPDDLFGELYREVVPVLPSQPSAEKLAEIVSDARRSRAAFRNAAISPIGTEQGLVSFLERAYGVAGDLGGDALANRFFVLVEAFLSKFSLRYDLRRPFTLHPTLPGVFARMISEVRELTQADPHLHALRTEFEEAFRNLTSDKTQGALKSCLHKQFNLLEGIGARGPGVNAGSLGDIWDQVRSWPHATIREAAKKMYGFRSNYPGIGHAGNPAGALRDIDLRDLIAISVVLAGFTPYLSDNVDSHSIYSG